MPKPPLFDPETKKGMAFRWAIVAVGGMILISATTFIGLRFDASAAVTNPAASASTSSAGETAQPAETAAAPADEAARPAESTAAPGDGAATVPAPSTSPGTGTPPAGAETPSESGAKTTPADQPLFILLRLGLPVLLMGWYAMSGYRLAQKARQLTVRTARVGQLADSLYFLGFLWTLWALIDSFVIHQLSIAIAVFRAFGYALVTTTAGMFFRLMLLQFQYSGDGIEAASEEVDKELAAFSTSLGATSKSIQGFREAADNAMTGWVGALTRSATTLESSVLAVVERTKGLDASIALVAEETKKLKDELAAARQVSEGLTTAHQGFVTQAGASTTAVRINAELLDKAAASNRTFIEKINDGAEAAKRHAKTLDRIDTSAAAALKGLSELERRLAHAASGLSYPTIDPGRVPAPSGVGVKVVWKTRRSLWQKTLDWFNGKDER